MPITLGAVTVPLAAALLVGWTVILGQKIARAEEISGSVWLLVLGIVSFAVIMAVLVLFSISLVREILEVRKQNSFIDSVTHELKSPLASIKLCLETLGRAEVDDTAREQLRAMMLGDVDRLNAFIDDVLQASRITHQGPSAVNLSEVSLRQVTAACADLMARRHGVSPGVIDVQVDPGLRLTTDSSVLEIVLKNLLDNALKYSRETPEVTVRGFVDDKSRVVLEVTDRGIGIDPAHRKRVFHRFYRVEDEAVRSRRGTGLGLFVVSALVRDLGGKVRAISDGPGHGTTMRVTLRDAEPRLDRAPAARKPEAA